MKRFAFLLTSSTLAGAALAPAYATDLEVTHWWTSAGEAAAVAEMAKAFDATGNIWVDAAIAGGGGTALPVIIGRIAGGNPMGATVLVHGRQAEELVQAGLMQDLTPLAEKEGWKDVVQPPSLLDSCTFEGKIYCVPTNIHSQQWLWLSNAAFEKAGVSTPTSWAEFVAAVPALETAGIMPLALGRQPWQSFLVLNVVMASVGGPELYKTVYGNKDAELAAGPEITKVFEALADARRLSAKSRVQDWNEATNLVITGQAAGQIMGDWAQAEFQLAGQAAGSNYQCLPGLGTNAIVSTGGNAFYFPVLDDEAKTEAQMQLASIMISPETQVAFNLKKGSLPVRGDVDLAAVNDCMKTGLALLAEGKTIPGIEQLITPDTQASLTDLAARFLADESVSVEDAQAEFAEIIGQAG
jgi:glucose/mannose transport system substrate-binding protein